MNNSDDIDDILHEQIDVEDEDDFEGSKHDDTPVWNLKFYERFFNVNTSDVLDRIVASFIPNYKGSLEHVKKNPDLYGPFWICVTLILTVTVSGNITNYLHSKGATFRWTYDFNLASYVSIVVLIYVFIIPLVIWLLLNSKFNQNSDDLSPRFLELFCIYGYSLFLFIPVAILWPIQIMVLQWSLVIIAIVLSMIGLLKRLAPIFLSLRCGVIYIISIICIHFILGSFINFYTTNFQVINTNMTVNTTHANHVLKLNVTHLK